MRLVRRPAVAGDHRELHVGDLAGRRPPHLPHRLGHVPEAREVPLREQPAGRVAGERPADLELARLDERADVVPAREAVRDQLVDHERREAIVELHHVDILGTTPRHAIGGRRGFPAPSPAVARRGLGARAQAGADPRRHAETCFPARGE